jgi:DNA helicase-2/ATP-dependent DNA helicase PcrA
MNNIILSQKQEDVVSFQTGALLVLASAGSGKTRVLTERIKRLANTTKRKILAITFTNKASEEIKQRLQDIPDIDERLFVATFHSFCCYVLENHGSAIGFQELPQIFSEQNDRLKVVEDAISMTPYLRKKYERMESKLQINFKNKALEIISTIKREVILDEDLDKEDVDEDVHLLYFNYRELMDSMNAIDFDDLLFLTYKLFICHPNIAALYRRTFEYICIDESQDLNKAQYMVLRSLTTNEHKNVMMVGDPKQSIYGFNGSSSQYMNIFFKQDYNPTIIELIENYRSTKNVLEMANKIMPNSSSLESVVIEGICELKYFDSVEDETKWVVGKILSLLKTKKLNDIEGTLTEDRIAVLARNKYVLSPIEDELKENKLNYYYKNTSSGLILDSTSGKIFNLALQIKINPVDKLHLSQLLRLVKLQKFNTLNEIANQTSDFFFKEVINSAIKLNDDGSNFLKEIDRILGVIGDKENEQNINENEIQLAHSDFIELRKHWHNYAVSTSNKSLSSFRNAVALGKTFQSKNEKGITLSTVHTMKGQENDVVFLIGLDDQTFPDYRAQKEGGLAMEQEKNNLYVAITRAKRYLFMTYPTSRKMPWGDVKKRLISSFLKDI